MRRLAAAACVLAGSFALAACYGPHADPGSPCAPDNTCPSGQTCVVGICQLPSSTSIDAPGASTDGRATDAPTDAPPVLGPDGWYPAKPVLGVNTSSVETDPSYTANRLTIVFASDRVTAGSFDLYIGTRSAANEPFTVTALTTVNSTNNENSPELEPTGAYIYFSSDRSGSWKIYQSTQTSGVWGAPAVVSSLTSSNANLSLGVAPDNTESMDVQQSGGKNKFEAYGRDMTGDSWMDEFEATEMEIANDANNPTLTDEGAVVYIDSGTPAQIYRSTSPNEGESFTTPALVGDLNLGTRDAAPFISADDNHIIFERDGDLYEADRLTP